MQLFPFLTGMDKQAENRQKITEFSDAYNNKSLKSSKLPLKLWEKIHHNHLMVNLIFPNL